MPDYHLPMEEILLGDSVIEVPPDLYENEDLFHTFFSVDTWNDWLPEDLKLHLLKFLPSFPENDIDEKARTIEMLFGGDAFLFRNPLELFRDDLLQGEYAPENAGMKEMILDAQKRNYHQWMDKYQFDIAQKCLDSRKKLLESASGTIVTVPKIDQGRVMKGGNMREKIGKRYKDEISRIKLEMGEEGFSSDDEEDEFHSANEDNTELLLEGVGTQSDEMEVEKQEPTIMDVVDTPLTQDMQPCFFSLLKDLLHQAPDQQLSLTQLESGVMIWQESPIAALNPWYNTLSDWRSSIGSALAFLVSGPTQHHPVNFSQMIYQDSSTGKYQWIGQDRDSDSELSDLTDWWVDRIDKYELLSSPTSPPPLTVNPPVAPLPPVNNSDPVPGNVTSWTVRPSSSQEKLLYQEQEARRYANPGSAWQWQCYDYSATVAPIKNINPGVRPKNHIMLVPDRPASVSLLTLVRDAVSRLPNGEGTRSDIVELLRDSQYLVPDVETSALTTTVSGALDRLQNDQDAPVKYDNNRKIWIYLHRAKTLEDYLNTSETDSKHQRQRQKRKFKLDSITPDVAPVAPKIPTNSQTPTLSLPNPSPPKTVQKIIVKGSDGKVIPLSTATLQKLIEAGTIKPGTQIATPEFKPDSTPTSGIIRIVQQTNKPNQTSQPASITLNPAPTLNSLVNSIKYVPKQNISPVKVASVQQNPANIGSMPMSFSVPSSSNLSMSTLSVQPQISNLSSSTPSMLQSINPVQGSSISLPSVRLVDGSLGNIGNITPGTGAKHIVLNSEQFKQLQASGKLKFN